MSGPQTWNGRVRSATQHLTQVSLGRHHLLPPSRKPTAPAPTTLQITSYLQEVLTSNAADLLTNVGSIPPVSPRATCPSSGCLPALTCYGCTNAPALKHPHGKSAQCGTLTRRYQHLRSLQSQDVLSKCWRMWQAAEWTTFFQCRCWTCKRVKLNAATKPVICVQAMGMLAMFQEVGTVIGIAQA